MVQHIGKGLVNIKGFGVFFIALFHTFMLINVQDKFV